MKHKAERIFLAAGTLLIAAGLAILLMNWREERRAQQSVVSVLPQMLEEIEAAASGPLQAEAAAPEDGEPAPSAQRLEIDGYDYIGYLSIPALGLELPVMEEWDYTRLKLSPCRYAGSAATGDLVICAHNYAHHFGTLEQLSAGDEVAFVETDGTVTHYEVAKTERLAATAVEEMTGGEYELTLFTCTYSGKARIAVRCARSAYHG